MLRNSLARESHPDEENSKPDDENTAQGEQRLDGEEYNVINHEDVEDLDEEVAAGVEAEAEAEAEAVVEEEEEENSFYRPGLAGLLGGRMMQRSQHTAGKFDHLHPFTQLLSVSNVDDCVSLENEVFPKSERCSREKFIYRLSCCPELSLGLFSRSTLSELAGNKNASPKHTLIAHISATRTPSRSVTDASMSFPADWKKRRSSLPKAGEAEMLGHQEQGGTVALHSLAVASEHQRKGLATILLKAYIERIKSAKIADRIALLAHDHLIKFYQGFGFIDEGPSEATFGGGQWNSMILEFSEQMDD